MSFLDLLKPVKFGFQYVVSTSLLDFSLVIGFLIFNMPPFQVAPCTIADGPGLARNNVSAFWDDKSWEQAWTRKNKNREYAITQATARWPYNLIKDLSHRRRYEKVVDVNTGELVGYANWMLPEASEEELEKMWPEAHGPRVDDETRELLKKRFDDADWVFNSSPNGTGPPENDMGSRLRGEEKWLGKYIPHYLPSLNLFLMSGHIDLRYLAVHPDHQRKGVATLLLESGIRAAEKMGIDVFVSSTRAGVPVYLKVGFTLLAEINKDSSDQDDEPEYSAYFSMIVQKQWVHKGLAAPTISGWSALSFFAVSPRSWAPGRPL
jgi:GNAT superfamily N-acetyltransferase